jgi:transcriptional regulator with XRE-family HTH domain
MTRKPIKPAERKGYRKYQSDPFFEKIQMRRMELGIKQEELAVMLGVHRAHISRMEAGAFPKDPERIRILCRALETDPNHLFGFEEEKRS